MLSLFCKIFVFLNLAFYGTLFLPTKLFSQSSDTSSSSAIATVDFSDLLKLQPGQELPNDLLDKLKTLQGISSQLESLSSKPMSEYDKGEKKKQLSAQKKNLLGNIETSINSIGGFKDNNGTVDKLLKRYSEGLSRQSSFNSLSRRSTTSSTISSDVSTVLNPADLSVPKPAEKQPGEPQTISRRPALEEPVVDRSLSQAMDALLAKQQSEIDKKVELARQKSRDRQVKKTEQNNAIGSTEMAVQTKAPPPSDQQHEIKSPESPKARPPSAPLSAKKRPTPNSVVAELSDDDNFVDTVLAKNEDAVKPEQNDQDQKPKQKEYPVVAPEFVASSAAAQTIRELEQKNQALELEKKKAEKLAEKAKAQAEKAAQEQQKKEEAERVKAQEEQAKREQEEAQKEKVQSKEAQKIREEEKAVQQQQLEAKLNEKKNKAVAPVLTVDIQNGNTAGAIRARIKKASSVQPIDTETLVQGSDKEDENGVPKLPLEKAATLRISRQQESKRSVKPAELEEEVVRVVDQEAADISVKPGSIRSTLVDSQKKIQARPVRSVVPVSELDDSAKKRAPLVQSATVAELSDDDNFVDTVLAKKEDAVKPEQNDQDQKPKQKEYPVVAPDFVASSAAAQRIQELEKESQQKSGALALEKKKSARAAAKLKNQESAEANESSVASVDPKADTQVDQVTEDTVKEQTSPADTKNVSAAAAGDGASVQAVADQPAPTEPVPVVGADAAAPKVEADDKKSSKIIVAVSNAMDKLRSKLQSVRDKISAKTQLASENLGSNTSSRVEIDTQTVSLPQKPPAADEPKIETETIKLAQESPKEQAVGIEKEVEGAKVQAEEAQKIREEEKRKQQELVDLAVENKRAANLKKAQAKKDVEDEKLVPLSESSKNSFTRLSEKAGRVEKSLAEKKDNLSISVEELKTSTDAGVIDILSAAKKSRATGGASLAARFIKNAAAGAALGDEGRDERKKARTAAFDKLKPKK